MEGNDHPFGFELGHGFGVYPLLWSYGGAEVEPDGKTVVIDSDETARAVDLARKFFQDTMFEDVLGWTDPSNNKAWYAEQISCTSNAESILWLAKPDFPEIAKVTDQALNPIGPKGRFHIMSSVGHAIFNFTPQQQEVRAFLRWLMDEKQLGGWYASADTYYQPYCTVTTTRRCGRSSRATFPIATRSPPPISPAVRPRRAGNRLKTSRNTWWSTCSPKPAPAPRQRR
jgi:multiple sugar transport system substrate-binding protein